MSEANIALLKRAWAAYDKGDEEGFAAWLTPIVTMREKELPTRRAVDKCGLCPHLKGFSPIEFSLRFGFYLPIPALATNACRSQEKE